MRFSGDTISMNPYFREIILSSEELSLVGTQSITIDGFFSASPENRVTMTVEFTFISPCDDPDTL